MSQDIKVFYQKMINQLLQNNIFSSTFNLTLTSLSIIQFELLLQMNDENLSFNSNLPSGFDDKPIGNKMKFDIPEYAQNEPPGMIAEVNVPQKLPLIKRLQSNALKTKKQALEELHSLVKTNLKEFKLYEELAIDLICYSHPSVVDKTLKIIVLYLGGGQQLNLDHKLFIKTILEKCLASEKAEKEEIKKSSEQVLFWQMDNKFEDVLLNELNECLINKNPKIVATSLLFISNLLNNYGIKRLKNLEKFSKHLDLLSLPPKPISKAHTIEFYKEVYRWMGQNTLKDFKLHMQVKDQIVKFGKEYTKVPMIIKRGIKKEVGIENKAIYGMDAEESQNQDEVDVLANYSSKWVDDTLEIAKWKDKKDVLDQFIKKTRVSCILPPRDISHYITLIKRLLAQNNISLLQCGFSVTQNLAKGLKRHFYNVAKNISPYIFNKLKDAKATIVEAAQETLKSLLFTLGLDDLMDDIKASLDDKAPMMKLQAIKFLANFASKRQQKIMNTLRTLIQKIVKLTEDGSEPVRRQALEFLCNLKKSHGTKFFGDKLKNLDSKKMAIVQQAKQSESQEMMDIEVNSQPNQSLSNANPENSKENSKMHIEEKIQTRSSKQIQKLPPKSMGSLTLKQQQPSVQSNVPPKSMKTVSNKTLNDLTSQNQSIRFNAYQQILTKTSYLDLKTLMYVIKSNAIRESSPNNLKSVIQIAKKHAGLDPIDLQTLEFIYKHDWKKAKMTLNDFIATSKFTPEASDYIRHNSIAISNSKVNSLTPPAAIQQSNLKHFMKQLEFLLSKMTNPNAEVRNQSAYHAINVLEPLPIITNQSDLTLTNGWNQQCINKFCGVVRFRLAESDQVASIYSKLLKMMIHKGLLTRNKGLKLIMQTIFAKLKEKKTYIKQIFEEIAFTNAQFLFTAILTQIIKEVSEPLIQFIIQNNDLFIRNAEIRVYICPFLQLIFNSDLNINLKTELEKILDQIIELNGEQVLEAEIKKTKLNSPNVEQYLAKYNISLNHLSFGKNINFKNDRIKMDEQNPWPIFIAPSHVLKLINQLISLKQPLPTLATPLPLSNSILQLVGDFDSGFISQYSDLLLKWVCWRTIIDQSEVIPHIIKFAYRVTISVKDFLTESQFTTLLSSMINVLERFKSDFHQIIGDLLLGIFEITPIYKDRSLSFWINFLVKEQNNQKVPVNQILKVLTSYYSVETLTQHLPTLARLPQVLKNQPFLRFLSSHIDHQFLTASGFRALSYQRQNKPTIELKPLLSDLGGPENIISINPEQKRKYINLFQKYSSMQLQEEIDVINKSPDTKYVIDTNMKIIYSIVVPFIKKEIPVINVFTYFRDLAKLFGNIDGSKYSHCLKDLARMLMYFLIDLDENVIDNKEEITKSTNKIILFILEKSDSRHMLEVLVVLIDYQLKLNININSKIQHLLYKCMGKVAKFRKFEQNWRQHLLYICAQTNNLFNKHDIKLDHPLIKTIRAIWRTEFTSNSTYFNFVDEYFKTHPINSTFLQILNDVTNGENVSLRDQSREKDIRSEANPIKSITTSSVNKLIAVKKSDL